MERSNHEREGRRTVDKRRYPAHGLGGGGDPQRAAGASHARTYGKGKYATEPGHRPASHARHLEWTPSRLVTWAERVGPNAASLVQTILASKPHPEQGYRSCLGLMRLGSRYSPERLEAAAQRALVLGGTSYHSVKSILDKGLDQEPLRPPVSASPLPGHANVRGPGYYAKREEAI